MIQKHDQQVKLRLTNDSINKNVRTVQNKQYENNENTKCNTIENELYKKSQNNYASMQALLGICSHAHWKMLCQFQLLTYLSLS